MNNRETRTEEKVRNSANRQEYIEYILDHLGELQDDQVALVRALVKTFKEKYN